MLGTPCGGLQPARATNWRNPASAAHYRIMQFSHRRLPHLYVIGAPLFLTFRLHNSLPPNREFPGGASSGKAFACMDRLLDEERAGPTYLRMPDVAQAVSDSIRNGASSNYLLHAWVVMPNHVHLLLSPKIEPSIVLKRLKGASAGKRTNCLA